jgi:hypothetical protein
MSRIVRVRSLAAQRNGLLRRIALALTPGTASLRAATPGIPSHLRDLTHDLDALQELIEATATAWEKRGYWVKSDHFRRTWAWVTKVQTVLQDEVVPEDPTSNPELRTVWERHLRPYIRSAAVVRSPGKARRATRRRSP